MKRKANNEGTISFREGRAKPYAAQISLYGFRVPQSFLTLEEAEAWIKEVKASKPGLGSEILVKDYLDQWIEKRRPKSNGAKAEKVDAVARKKAALNGETAIAYNTHRSYEDTIHNHILPLLSPRLRLGMITRKDIETLLVKSPAEVGSRTLQVIRRVLHKAFSDAVSSGLITINPVTDIKTPYKAEERPTLSPEEGKRLILVARGTAYQNLIPVALTSVAREGELLGAFWTDIDWENKVLHISRQVQRQRVAGKLSVQKKNKSGIGSVQVFVDTKTDASNAPIPLGETTIKYLREQQAFILIMKAAAGKHWKENNLIFPSSVGTPIEPSSLRRKFKVFLKEACLPEDLHFHDLRHSGITNLSDPRLNVPLRTRQRRARHKSEATTMLYTHPIEGLDEKAAEALDKLILPDPSSLPIVEYRPRAKYQRKKNKKSDAG